MSDSTKKEASILVRDIKEQVLYLQELGVETFDIDLPKFELNPQPKPLAQKTESNYSLPEEPLSQKLKRRKTEDKQTPRESAKRRTDFLSATRISNVSSNQESEERKPVSEKRKSASLNNEKPMTKKPSLTETLFGDASVALPETDETLELIRNEIGKDCSRCPLSAERTQVVNSVGDPNADLMFIGEAPGADEDEKGEPFVGRAGKLLTKIIEAMKLTREQVFIGNINRCRPPGNRQPVPDEVEQCKPFLIREISVVRPKVIVVMGNTACQNLLGTKVGITKLRGKFQDYYGVKVMPTFHPAYLLRDPRKKREVWEDMKMVTDFLANN